MLKSEVNQRKSACAVIFLGFVLALAILGEGCSGPSWMNAGANLSITAKSTSPTVGLTSQFQISGGVAPYSVSLTGPGTLLMQNSSTILYDRPWNVGTSQISVSDALGASSTVTLQLTGGAIQLGGGADPTTVPLQFAQDALGNTYVMGSTQAVLTANFIGTPGLQSVYLAKITSLGIVQWIVEISAGSLSTTTATQLVVTANGDSWIAGTTDGALSGAAIGGHGQLDGFVGKISTDGSLQWLTQFGGSAGAQAAVLALQVDPGGSGWVAGHVANGSFSGVAGRILSGSGQGAQDVFVAKILGATGAVSWLNEISGGGSSINSFAQLKLSPSTGAYVLGQTTGLIVSQSGVTGSNDTFIGRVAAAGTLTWARQWGGGGGTNTTPVSLLVDSNDVSYLLANTTGSGGVMIANASAGPQGGIITKLSAAGAEVWTDQLSSGAASNISVLSGALDALNKVYIMSISDTDMSAYGTQLGSVGPANLVVMKLAAAGAISWLTQIGAGGAIASTQPLIAANGNVYLDGTVTGSLGGTQFGTAGSNQDLFLVNLNSSSGGQNWVLQAGGGGLSSSSPAQFVVDSLGNVFVAGQTSGTVGVINGSHGNSDALVLKINSNGSVAWLSQFGGGGSSLTLASSLILDSQGQAYILGPAQRLLVGTLIGPNNFSNAFVAKFSSNGLLQ